MPDDTDGEATAFTKLLDDLIGRIESGAEACEYDKRVLERLSHFENGRLDVIDLLEEGHADG